MNFIKKNFSIILYSVLLAIYGNLILYTSALRNGASAITGTDSSVFVYIAEGMKEGLVPYSDMFDHKGVLLYIINLIGLIVFNGKIGIWFLEMIFMYANFFIVWKTVKLFSKSKMIAFFTVLITFLPFAIFYEGGNLVEEWALPFILAILYMCIKYLKNRLDNYNISKGMWLINGFCTAAILWMRPNMIVVTLVFIGTIGLDLLIRKQFKKLGKCILWFGIGASIISLPIIIYLIKNNAFKHCFNSYILFNFTYIGDKAEFNTILSTSIMFWAKTALSSLSFFVCVIGMTRCKKKDYEYFILLTSAIFIIVTYLVISLSARDYAHYAMICIPSFVYPTYYALNAILQNKKQGISTFFILIILIAIVFCNETSKIVTGIIESNDESVSKDKLIADYIKERTKEDDEVIVIGNCMRINLLSNRRNSAKYFYQTPVADVEENIAKDFLTWINNSKPEVIVCTIKELTRKDSLYRTEIFNYLDKIVKDREYIENKNEFKDIIIYEKAK